MDDRRVDILLVDDDPDDVFLIKYAFEAAAPDAYLVPASDADEARSVLAQCIAQGMPPRIILLDVNLPRTDGLQLLREFRSQHPPDRIRIIMLSSSTEPHEVEAAYGAGANGYLAKEADMDAFDRVVRGIVEYLAMLRDPFQPRAADQRTDLASSA